ncbi:general secretion pathway protein [Flavobacterium suaedae]|uniref:General secretion pathway protein n=1 Tax=Flavobacterium suaedae TaxID=1767027 RepID=A0ABQ1JPA0_9FLAO|nr:general secretion pathway protein [Flavobacterium suaedae]GGB73366.1 general secretion pathway protein [Flavobacterium suaedae]
MKLNKNNKLLLLVLALLLYLCYSFAFSKTINYYKEYQSKKELVNSALSNPDMLKQLTIRKHQLDTILAQYAIAQGESFQNELLKKITALSTKYHLKITDFKEPHVITDNGVKTSSYIFTLEGSFNDMALLINTVENDITLGAVKSVSFIKHRNYRTYRDFLTGEIILQKNETVKEKPQQ